ncbi:hypothetical protein Tco_1156863 [Tanacetum coccineum]
MSTLTFADTHNMVVFLEKPAESNGYHEIIDFLNANQIRYALTVNPTIYTSCIEQFWATTKVKTVNRERGTHCLPNDTIFEELARMGYEKPSLKPTFYKAFFTLQWKFLIHTITQCLSAKTTAWNEFSSLVAFAIICLATNQKFNLSKYIFDVMKFDFATVKTTSTPIETNKSLVKDEEAEAVDVYLYRLMIGSLMYLTAFRPDITFAVCACARDSPFDLEAFFDSDYAGASLDRKSTTRDETVHKELGDKMERAATTASSLEEEQDSGNINRTQSMATLNEPSPYGTGSCSGPRCQVTILGLQMLKLGLRLHLNSPMIHLSQELTHLEVGRTV